MIRTSRLTSSMAALHKNSRVFIAVCFTFYFSTLQISLTPYLIIFFFKNTSTFIFLIWSCTSAR